MDLLGKLAITVVVPVHNGGSSFRECLSSLVAATRPPDEIIVVADGESDGSWRQAEEFGAKTILLPTSNGPAKARNLGAQAASGDILFFIDADVTIHKDTISFVEQIFIQEPNLAAAIGSYDDEPGASNFLSQYKNLFHHYTHQTGSEEAFTFWGACGAIRREVFFAVGGFDESYRRPSIEDIEIGYRLKNAGYAIRLCKDLQVKHLKQWGALSLLKAEIFYRALPWTELIWRDRQLNNDLNLGTTSRWSVILVFVLLLALSGSLWLPKLIGVAIVSSLGLLALNLAVYRFFLEKRGLWFTLQVIPWHWFYYLYGGLAFAFGTLRFLLHRGQLVESQPTKSQRSTV